MVETDWGSNDSAMLQFRGTIITVHKRSRVGLERSFCSLTERQRSERIFLTRKHLGVETMKSCSVCLTKLLLKGSLSSYRARLRLLLQSFLVACSITCQAICLLQTALLSFVPLTLTVRCQAFRSYLWRFHWPLAGYSGSIGCTVYISRFL